MGLLNKPLSDKELEYFIPNKKINTMSFLKKLWSWLFGSKKNTAIAKVVTFEKEEEIDFPSSVAPTVTPTVDEVEKPTAKSSSKPAAKSNKKPAAKNGKGKK